MKDRSLKTMAGLVAVRALTLGLGVLMSVMWARCISEELYGRYQVVGAWVAIVGVFCLNGLADSALISASKGKDGNFGRVVRQRMLASLIGGAILLVAAAWKWDHDQPLAVALAVSAGCLPVLLQNSVWSAWANGKKKFRLLGGATLGLQALNVLVLAVVIVFGVDDVVVITLAFHVSSGAAYVGLLWFLSRSTIENSETDEDILRYGRHLTLAGLFAWVFASDKIFVDQLLSARDVAVLAVALVLPNQLKIFFTAWEQVFLPRVSSADGLRQAWSLVKRRFPGLVGFYAVVSVAGFFALPVVVPLLFSQRYVDAVPYARWLWLTLGLSAPFTFLGSILNAQRDTTFAYVKNLGSPLLTLGLFAVLIPPLGVWGAVVARGANHLAITVLHVTWFAKRLQQAKEPST